MALDGKISGPVLSQTNPNTSFLSGTQRMFSDQTARQTSLLSPSNMGTSNNLVSNTGTPAGNAGSMNVGNNAFNGQDVTGSPANYRVSDGVMSGPSISGQNNVGYHLSDSAPATFDKAPNLVPSGAVSDTLGGKELMASNDVPSYQPSMGGSYFRPAGAESAAGGQSAAPMQELHAEPMQMMKHAHPTPSLGHTPDKGAVDYIGHQSKGALHVSGQQSTAAPTSSSSGTPSHQSMDQVAHRGSPGHANAERLATSQTSGDLPHHVDAAPKSHAMDQVAHAKPHNLAHMAKPANIQHMAKPEMQQMHPGVERTAMSNAGAGADKVSNYTLHSGDNLWDIARKNLGNGSRWSEIYKLNTDNIGGNPDLIHPGLDLKMPDGADSQVADAAGNYTVQPGDNLWNIARSHLHDGGRWGEIYNLNKSVIGDNPRLILPGEQLQIPGQQMISQAPQAAAAAPQTVAMNQTTSMSQSPPIDPSGSAPQEMAQPAVQSDYKKR
jgi:nucleoid-associated protein YgaU